MHEAFSLGLTIPNRLVAKSFVQDFGIEPQLAANFLPKLPQR